MHVLIVDNDIANRLVARSILTRDGHTTGFAANGTDALSVVSGQAFDIVLLDIMMPGLNGLQVSHRLNNSHLDHSPMLIALTAYNKAEEIRAYRQAGLAGLIAKPLRPGDLNKAVKGIRSGHYPMLNCHTTDDWRGETRPLIDEAVVRNGPGLADDVTRERIWRHYRVGLSESLREISKSLPGTLAGYPGDTARMQAALHALRSASLMVGMDRAPILADRLRHTPRHLIIHAMTELLRTVRESLPPLQKILLEVSRHSVATRQEAGRMQVRR